MAYICRFCVCVDTQGVGVGMGISTWIWSDPQHIGPLVFINTQIIGLKVLM